MKDDSLKHGVQATQPASGGGCFSVTTARRFAHGDLSAAQFEQVERHMDACPACHARVAAALVGDATSPDNHHELPIGTQLAGRYELVGFLGRGGMGDVYEAHDQLLDERVAVKLIGGALAGSPEGMDLLRAEVQLARRISHPHVCRVFELWTHPAVGGAPERPFLVMELLSGGCLGPLVRRGSLGPERVEGIARQLLRGLSAAHAAGVIHRDFKSDNVLFRARSPGSDESEPAAVITDFGLARAFEVEAGHITTARSLVGTAAYMAPEQVEGGQLSPATDLYCLGVVLFETLTGRLPFVGATPLATALMRLNQPVPAPSSLRPELAPAWDTFVAALMERDPARRPASAQAALAELEALAPTQATSIPGARGATRPRLKPTRLVAAAALAALAAGLAPDPADARPAITEIDALTVVATTKRPTPRGSRPPTSVDTVEAMPVPQVLAASPPRPLHDRPSPPAMTAMTASPRSNRARGHRSARSATGRRARPATKPTRPPTTGGESVHEGAARTPAPALPASRATSQGKAEQPPALKAAAPTQRTGATGPNREGVTVDARAAGVGKAAPAPPAPASKPNGTSDAAPSNPPRRGDTGEGQDKSKANPVQFDGWMDPFE
ncbi:MAG: protein kinase [Myxococcales bacterium]|nr:protein kinase [Myxococcales bacterium]